MENVNNLKSKKILIYQNGKDIYSIPEGAKKVSIITGTITLKDGSKKDITATPEQIIRNGMLVYLAKNDGKMLLQIESARNADCFKFVIKTRDGKEVTKIIPVNMTKEMNVLVDEDGNMLKYHL